MLERVPLRPGQRLNRAIQHYARRVAVIEAIIKNDDRFHARGRVPARACHLLGRAQFCACNRLSPALVGLTDKVSNAWPVAAPVSQIVNAPTVLTAILQEGP